MITVSSMCVWKKFLLHFPTKLLVIKKIYDKTRNPVTSGFLLSS